MASNYVDEDNLEFLIFPRVEYRTGESHSVLEFHFLKLAFNEIRDWREAWTQEEQLGGHGKGAVGKTQVRS